MTIADVLTGARMLVGLAVVSLLLLTAGGGWVWARGSKQLLVRIDPGTSGSA
ncbi:MAG: hypothetical protein ACM3QU_05465 [Verrucomicrobiota bacterium]